MTKMDYLLLRSDLYYIKGYVAAATDNPYDARLKELINEFVEKFDELGDGND